MFTHVMIGSNDLKRSKGFYDATFAALRGNSGEMDERGRLIYAHSRLLALQKNAYCRGRSQGQAAHHHYWTNSHATEHELWKCSTTSQR